MIEPTIATTFASIVPVMALPPWIELSRPAFCSAPFRMLCAYSWYRMSPQAHDQQQHHRADDREFDDGRAAPVARQPPPHRRPGCAPPHCDIRSIATCFAMLWNAVCNDAESLAK